jgi:VWFA-related protein
MRRPAVFVLVMLAAVPVSFASQLSVRELEGLILSARAAGATDADVAHKVSRVEIKERLTEGALADIRADSEPKTDGVLALLADESEFEPGVEILAAAPPSPIEGAAVLARARAFAANYIHNLPDFICNGVIRRFDNRPERRSNTEPTLDGLRLRDTITSEVSFDHGKDSYAAQTVNGQAHRQTVPGLTTWGEFGGIIEELLTGSAGLATEWSRWEAIDGKRVAVFRYSVDRQHSRYTVSWCCDAIGRKEIRPEYRGELFIEPVSGSVVRLTRRAVFLPGFPIQRIDTMVEYGPVGIGGNSYICPVKSVTVSFWKAGVVHPPGFADPAGFAHLMHSLSEVRFSSYQKFGTSSMLVAENAQPDANPDATVHPNAAFASPATAAPTASVEAPAQGPAVELVKPNALISRPPASGTIIRSTTRLVDVSAVVVDKHGSPVTDLKKEDFQVYDEGKRQDIRLFSPPAAMTPVSAEAQPAPSPEVSPSRVFSNRVEDSSRPSGVTIILLDRGIATSEEWRYAQGRIIRFLEQVPPEERVGLYRPVLGGIGIVSEFTQDHSDLASKLDGGFESEAAAAGWGGSNEEHKECSANYALEAISASADHLAGIPARKNLIWISGGDHAPGPPIVPSKAQLAGAFPTSVGAPNTLEKPQSCFKEEMQAVQAANRANVSLYSIDFRGLETGEPDATIGPRDVNSPLALNALVLAKLDSTEKDQSILRDVAERTGGRAYFDNDILGALRAASAESQGAYELGFYSEPPRFDGAYRRLDVKVLGRRDITVRYRRGYIDARESPDPEAEMRDAMQSPLDANTIALTAEVAATDGGGYDVKLRVGVGDLERDDNGQWQGRIHVVLANRDDVGQPLDHLDDTLQLELKPDRYEAMRKDGLAYHRSFQPNPKATSLRVVVLDEAGNLGSVTIPLTPPEKQLQRR